MNALAGEILLSFWKLHILHHARSRPVYGLWIIEELRRHGHEISPGTLYPILKRMTALGWLAEVADPDRAPRGRRYYRLTPEGRKILGRARRSLVELHREIVLGDEGEHR